MQKLRTILFTGNEVPKPLTIDHESYKDLAKAIGCDTIDVVAIKIGGIDYDLVVNDNGLYESDTVTAIWGGENRAVYQTIKGPCIVLKSNGDGEFEGLSIVDALNIIDNVACYKDVHGREGFALLYNMGIVPPTHDELMARMKEILGDDAAVVEA